MASASGAARVPPPARPAIVDLYIGNDCCLREVCCRNALDAAASHGHASLCALHGTSDLDYRQPNDFDCWHCCGPFAHPPVPVPRSFDIRLKTFEVFGNFCGFACAKAYAADHFVVDSGRGSALLQHMALAHYNTHIAAVVRAPPRVALRRFGGNLTLDEFRGSTSHVVVEAPPFVSSRQVIHKPMDAAASGAWSVYDMGSAATAATAARADAPGPAPAITPGVAGQRGMYFDYLKQQGQLEQLEGRPREPRNARAGRRERGARDGGEDGDRNRGSDEEDADDASDVADAMETDDPAPDRDRDAATAAPVPTRSAARPSGSAAGPAAGPGGGALARFMKQA